MTNQTFNFNSAAGDPISASFDGGDGVDTLVANFGVENISTGARVTSQFTLNPDGSFTVTYRNNIPDKSDSVTVTNVENIRISTANTYRWTDGNIYSLDTEDEIRTGFGNDVVNTFGGEDKVDVGLGLDTADGGNGIDGIGKDLSDSTGAISWNLETGSYSGPGSFVGFEYFLDLRTGSGNDVVKTGKQLWTNSAFRDDTISTGSGNDAVFLFIGRDIAHMGAGNDRLTIDWTAAEFTNNTTMVLNADPGGGYSGSLTGLQSGAPSATFSGVEHFTISTNVSGGNGTNLADTIVTGDGNDVISTFISDDKIDVGRGVDSVDGGVGNDGLAKEFGENAAAIKIDLAGNTYSGPGSYTNLEYFLDLRTGAGNDVVVTTNVNGSSGQGDDVIFTRGGNDSVTLMNGDDNVDLGSGSDRLIIDWTAANFTNNTTMVLNGTLGGGYSGSLTGLQSGAPSATFSGVEHFTISTNVSGGNGTNLADTIVTGDGNDIVSTFISDDKISVGRGVDTVDGGIGLDGLAKEFGTAPGPIKFNLVANTFSGPGSYKNLEYFLDLRTGNSADVIVTSKANNSSGGGDDVIFTRGGSDTVTVFNGYDKVDLGAGLDRLVIDYRDTFTGNAVMTLDWENGGYQGSYLSSYSDSPKVEFAGVEHFTIRTSVTGGNGTNLQDTIVTGFGNDVVETFRSADKITVGRGNDSVDGGEGVDGIGKDFSDRGGSIRWNLASGYLNVAGSYKNLEYFLDLRTGSGADVIKSGPGTYNDLVSTGGGNDSAHFFGGADTYNGGTGKDRLVLDYRANDGAYSALKLTLTANAAGGYDGSLVSRPNQQVVFTNVESFTIYGSEQYSYSETITTGAGNDYVSLFLGNDTIDAGAGNDTLVGGAGKDKLLGGSGTDILDGGTDNDILDGGTGADTMSGGLGDDSYFVDSTLDRVIERSGQGVDTVESIVGYTLPSNVEKLVLSGGAAINGVGNGLANTITGNGAANTLKGAGGNDTLNGGLGNDKLYGATGNDILNGGGGKDGFYFDTPLNKSSNVDTIAGFVAADDTIFLDRDVFKAIGANGTLSAAAFRVGTAAADASDRIVYDQATGKIFYDSDGAGGAAAVLFARVDAGTVLTSADFSAFI